MNIEMVKHSYNEAFGSISENVACWVDGKYTKVCFKENGVVVYQNTPKKGFGTPTQRKLTAKGKIAKITEFVKANIEEAK